jgi:hypothetical protein
MSTQVRYTGTVEPWGGGNGVSGATVTLTNIDTNDLITTTTSGDGGSFSVDISDQDVKFAASKSGAGELVVSNVNVESLSPNVLIIPVGGGE